MKKDERKTITNPFTPSFGSVPPEIAGREDIINKILSGIDNGVGDPNRASILNGARGTGKTVLLTKIAAEAEMKGWIAVNVTSGVGLLNETIVQLLEKTSHLLRDKKTKTLTGAEIGPFGFTLDVIKERTSWRAEMSKMISELNENSIGLLITIDEINPDDKELKIVVDAFQHFVREQRDVAILMAGLPHNVSQLLNDEKTSFLRRAYQHTLEPIEYKEVAYALKKTIEENGRTIALDALKKAAENTKGFAFFIQLLGYHMWRQSPDSEEILLKDVVEATQFAEMDMRKMVLDSTYRELTDREKQFVEAMAADTKESRISEIAKRMQIENNNASKLQRRLLERGVIYRTGRGRIDFVMPLLREYLRDNTV